MRVLKLDQAYKPVEIIPWTEAMRLIYLEKAEVVEEYKDQFIRTPNKVFKTPSIIRIIQGVEKIRKLRFSRDNIYRRDEYTCQYCLTPFDTPDLTLDHVVPASKGGKKTWENIVTACRWCNGKKADKSLDQFGIKLLRKPEKPKYSPRMILRLQANDPESWKYFVPF